MGRTKRRVQQNPQFQQNGVELLQFITNLSEYVLSHLMWDKALKEYRGIKAHLSLSFLIE